MAMFHQPCKIGAIVLTKFRGHAANAEIVFDIEILIPSVRDSRVTPEPAKRAFMPGAHKRLVGRYA